MEDRNPNSLIHPPQELELPKPSPPITLPNYPNNFQDQICDLERPESYPEIPKHFRNGIQFSPSSGKTPKEEKEAVSELLAILVDCMDELNTRTRETLLRKFFSEIEGDERLEKFIVERLSQSKVKAISEMCEHLPTGVQGQNVHSDDLNSLHQEFKSSSQKWSRFRPTNDEVLQDGENCGTSFERGIIESVEELSEALERFKIRTVDLGGVVKEEEKK
ncbi:Formin like [Actinidia chinensis var. chinensis]|uniref:Formin like n=1 Tax=Actinidia chinensis var. chinensis TaxID=1590841 RepID=A0A2R6Q3F6_ACTCC|nr:Formin like [Actinidia chinensis var. chinensis]